MAILHVSHQALHSLSQLECHLEDQVSKSAHVDQLHTTRLKLKSLYLFQQIRIFNLLPNFYGLSMKHDP